MIWSEIKQTEQRIQININSIRKIKHESDELENKNKKEELPNIIIISRSDIERKNPQKDQMERSVIST